MYSYTDIRSINSVSCFVLPVGLRAKLNLFHQIHMTPAYAYELYLCVLLALAAIDKEEEEEGLSRGGSLSPDNVCLNIYQEQVN